MKKIFAILMSMMLIFTFIGCSGTEQKEEGQQDMKVTDSVQAESEETVSYTHLDVYKRQWNRCSKRERLLWGQLWQ